MAKHDRMAHVDQPIPPSKVRRHQPVTPAAATHERDVIPEEAPVVKTMANNEMPVPHEASVSDKVMTADAR
jgi:hypothetical protein